MGLVLLILVEISIPSYPGTRINSFRLVCESVCHARSTKNCLSQLKGEIDLMKTKAFGFGAFGTSDQNLHPTNPGPEPVLIRSAQLRASILPSRFGQRKVRISMPIFEFCLQIEHDTAHMTSAVFWQVCSSK